VAGRKPKLKTLKRKSPKIPDFTCSDIDRLINLIENLDVLKRGQLYRFKRGMEKLRNSNDKLRESGVYWYEEVKKLLTK
jgi:hypothetical protein